MKHKMLKLIPIFMLYASTVLPYKVFVRNTLPERLLIELDAYDRKTKVKDTKYLEPADVLNGVYPQVDLYAKNLWISGVSVTGLLGTHYLSLPKRAKDWHINIVIPAGKEYDYELFKFLKMYIDRLERVEEDFMSGRIKADERAREFSQIEQAEIYRLKALFGDQFVGGLHMGDYVRKLAELKAGLKYAYVEAGKKK